MIDISFFLNNNSIPIKRRQFRRVLCLTFNIIRLILWGASFVIINFKGVIFDNFPIKYKVQILMVLKSKVSYDCKFII